MMQCASYQQCLDSIFESYMAVKPLIKGKFDREVRRPWVVLGVAHELGLLPPRERTVRITGSKGKGTTSRLVAQGIAAAQHSAVVGLLVSPEEIDHTDRMRVNGQCISRNEFVRCYNEILPALAQRQFAFDHAEYFSPSGLFLLIALLWFKRRGVTHYVLEGGRGVSFDEVGNISSRVSIVTSVFSEHLNCIGPTESDVASDKLSIAKTSDVTLLGASALRWNGILKAIPESRWEAVVALGGSAALPDWVEVNRALAARAVELLLGLKFNNEALSLRPADFPSFGVFETAAVSGFYECLISRESLDSRYFATFARQGVGACAAVVSLPDDKDLDGIVNRIEHGFGVPVFHVPLTGTRGYLDYARTERDYGDKIIERIAFDGAPRFADVFFEFCSKRNISRVAVLGTQSYIRLFRNALAILEKSSA